MTPERRAEMGLQRLDLEGQRGGRDAELGRRILEGQVAGGGLEGAERGERGQAIGHLT